MSGLVAAPTLLLGGLAGAATGAIHGPFIKLGGGGKKEEKPMSDEEINAKAMRDAEALDQAVEKSASTVPQPPKLEDDKPPPRKQQPRSTNIRPPLPMKSNHHPQEGSRGRLKSGLVV